MKKTILIIMVLFIFIISVASSTYKLSLKTLQNEYEEVCTKYQKNVSAIPQCYYSSLHTYSSDFFDCNESIIEVNGRIMPYKQYRHEYIQTDICIEYSLVKRIKKEEFIYNFEWCEVYPNSKEC